MRLCAIDVHEVTAGLYHKATSQASEEANRGSMVRCCCREIVAIIGKKIKWE